MLSPLFKGDICITHDINLVYDILKRGIDSNKIVNLDEDMVINNPNVVVGNCLLPPPAALMAEVDGDEAMYDSIYYNYCQDDFMIKWFNAILGSLYVGNSIMFYYPPINDNEIKTISKFINMLYAMIGIHVGCIERNEVSFVDQTDYKRMIQWSEILYRMKLMSAEEFLYWRPIITISNYDTDMEEDLYETIAADLQLVCDSYESARKFIRELIIDAKQGPINLGIYKITR